MALDLPARTPESDNAPRLQDSHTVADRESDLQAEAFGLDDPGFVGDSTFSLLKTIIAKIDAIATNRKTPAATVIDLTPTSGLINSAVSKSHVRLRVNSICITGGTAGHVLQVKSGVRVVAQYIAGGGNGPIWALLDVVIDRGSDFGIFDTDGASTNFAAYVIAYPE